MIIVANNLNLLSPVGVQISCLTAVCYIYYRLTCYIIMQCIIYYVCMINKIRLMSVQSCKNNDFSYALR